MAHFDREIKMEGDRWGRGRNDWIDSKGQRKRLAEGRKTEGARGKVT